VPLFVPARQRPERWAAQRGCLDRLRYVPGSSSAVLDHRVNREDARNGSSLRSSIGIRNRCKSRDRRGPIEICASLRPGEFRGRMDELAAKPVCTVIVSSNGCSRDQIVSLFMSSISCGSGSYPAWAGQMIEMDLISWEKWLPGPAVLRDRSTRSGFPPLCLDAPRPIMSRPSSGVGPKAVGGRR